MKKSIILLLQLAICVVTNSSLIVAQETGQPKLNEMTAHAIFKILSWNETTFSTEEEDGKLTRVSVEKSYQGELTGLGKLEYLMRYQNDGSADFYGLERVNGYIKNRSGSFVLEHTGIFRDGVMTQKSVVLEESGTKELKGLRGETTLTAGHQEEYSFDFYYEFE